MFYHTTRSLFVSAGIICGHHNLLKFAKAMSNGIVETSYMGNTLPTVFIVGGSWFTGCAVISFFASCFRWRRCAENPGHLVVWAHAVLAVLYWFLYVDWDFYLRGDGVELPWLRIGAEILIYLSYAWMVAVSLWLDWDDAIIAVAGTGFGGAMVSVSHLARPDLYWWGMAVGGAVLALIQLWQLRRSRRPDEWAWVFWAGWLIWIIGVPLTQLLGWTMTEALDKSPERNTTEIVYLVVYALSVTLYGWLQIFFFSSRPLNRPLEHLTPAGIPEQVSGGFLSNPNELVSSGITRRSQWTVAHE